MAPKVERLVNLTIALLEARRPLTFTEIKRRTGFYRQDDTESARRMFERDKDDLRQLGVPIELAQSVFDEEPGYLVRRKDYELPDIDLTADEVAALALAVQLAGGEHARLTLSRLAARAPDPRTAPDDIPLHVTLTADAIDAFADAIVDRRVATFRYRTAGGAIGDRVVEPFAVVQRRGAWYLVGRDRDRAALRTFRLDRIVGAPRIGDVADAFERPDDLDLTDAVSGPDVHGCELVVDVAAHARWAVESRGGTAISPADADVVRMRIADFDPDRDLPWLLGIAADVTVLTPASVANKVIERLEAVRRMHAATR